MKTDRNHMYRSGTMPFSLPKISKLANTNKIRYDSHSKNSFHTSRIHNKSFQQEKTLFIKRVEQQVLDQNEYPFIQTNNIQKQHTKLKDLLKQFNQQTLQILEKYIDKPVKKQYVKKRPPIQSLHFIKEKQVENSTNIIVILKNEIDKLQSRCENLKYISREQFQTRIKQIKEQKQDIIQLNKDLSREVTLNGLQIFKGKQCLVKQLEQQQYLIYMRRSKLKKDTQRVRTQNLALQLKIDQINEKMNRYQEQQGYTIKMFEQTQKQKIQYRLSQQLRQKNRLYQHIKIMTSSSIYQLKHQYFQKLKELDNYTCKNDQDTNKLNQYEEKIKKSKQKIEQMEIRQIEMSVKSVNVKVGSLGNTTSTKYKQIYQTQPLKAKINRIQIQQ